MSEIKPDPMITILLVDDIVDTRDQRDALQRRAEYLKAVRSEGVIPMAAAAR